MMVFGTLSTELMRVKQNNKYGYVNHKGELVISLQYDKASLFKNGRASVVRNGESFEINTLGEVIGRW